MYLLFELKVCLFKTPLSYAIILVSLEYGARFKTANMVTHLLFKRKYIKKGIPTLCCHLATFVFNGILTFLVIFCSKLY